jgi:hypothetical protein
MKTTWIITRPPGIILSAAVTAAALLRHILPVRTLDLPPLFSPTIENGPHVRDQPAVFNHQQSIQLKYPSIQ